MLIKLEDPLDKALVAGAEAEAAAMAVGANPLAQILCIRLLVEI